MLIKKMLIKALCFFKYKNIKFKSIGNDVFYQSLRSNFTYSKNISLGNNVHIGPGADFDGAGNITIKNGCIFAPNVIIYSRTHYFDGVDLEALPFDNKMICAEVVIGDYVWIGRNVIILPGVEIGEGAIIGAGAVVSKNIPVGGVAVGNPAKVVKFRDMKKYDDLKNRQKFVYNNFNRKKVFINKSDV